MKKIKQINYTLLAKYLARKYSGYKRKKYEDRSVLEEIIFPYILSHRNPRTILDIGREEYQKFYNLFFKGRELWTLDNDPQKKEFGCQNHITDNISNLKKYFQDNYFDFILMNGVFGWGLDQRAEIEKAFNAIYDVLRPEGIFILGYNDDIIPLEEISGLKKLEPFWFAPLKGEKFKCANGNHIYNFYIKK